MSEPTTLTAAAPTPAPTAYDPWCPDCGGHLVYQSRRVDGEVRLYRWCWLCHRRLPANAATAAERSTGG